jgi:hypothetical protein
MEPETLQAWIRDNDYSDKRLATELAVPRTTVRRWVDGDEVIPRIAVLALRACAQAEPAPRASPCRATPGRPGSLHPQTFKDRSPHSPRFGGLHEGCPE